MLALEIASVREYYHVRDHNFNQFPPILQKFGAVGQIAEDSFYVYTLDWGCDPNVFPMRHGCLVGIQIIPITSVSRYWMDKVYNSLIILFRYLIKFELYILMTCKFGWCKWILQDWSKHLLQTCDWAINPSHATGYSLANPGDLRDLVTVSSIREGAIIDILMWEDIQKISTHMLTLMIVFIGFQRVGRPSVMLQWRLTTNLTK